MIEYAAPHTDNIPAPILTASYFFEVGRQKYTEFQLAFQS